MQHVAMLVATDLLHDSRVRKEAQTLAAAGYRVTVYSHIREDEVTRLGWDQEPGLSAVPVGPGAWQKMRGPGRGLSHGEDLLRWGGGKALLAAAAGTRAGVYHAHDLDTLPAAAWLARRSSARLVFDAHELFVDMMDLGQAAKRLPLPNRIKQWVARRNYARLQRTLIGRANAVITVSDGIADELVRRYAVARPAVVLNAPPYRDVSQGSHYLHERLGLAADRRIVLLQGAVLPGRGLVELVQTLPLLPDCYDLVFLGFNLGTFQEPIQREIARLGLAARTHLLDALPGDELLTATASADVGLILLEGANLNDRLALPNKLFEYMMAGLPFVAVGWPEIARVVEETGAGMTIDSLAPAVLANGITRVLADPIHYSAMRRAGLEAARTRYRWERQAERLLDVYARLYS